MIGNRDLREIVIGDRVRAERVIAAFAGNNLYGYLAFRLGRTGPFTVGSREFRAQFGAVAGTMRYLGYRLLARRPRRGEIFIDGFLVSAEARGGGIGARLLAEGERIGREAGKDVLRVRVRADNPRAAAFYLRQGFVREGASEISWISRVAGMGPVSTFAKRL